MSGSYDLLLFVTGPSLQEVAELNQNASLPHPVKPGEPSLLLCALHRQSAPRDLSALS